MIKVYQVIKYDDLYPEVWTNSKPKPEWEG